MSERVKARHGFCKSGGLRCVRNGVEDFLVFEGVIDHIAENVHPTLCSHWSTVWHIGENNVYWLQRTDLFGTVHSSVRPPVPGTRRLVIEPRQMV
jgi:hypothetical protein